MTGLRTLAHSRRFGRWTRGGKKLGAWGELQDAGYRKVAYATQQDTSGSDAALFDAMCQARPLHPPGWVAPKKSRRVRKGKKR